MFDTHIHTEISSDSEMKLEEILDTIDKNNIGVIITDHMDLKYPKEGKFIFDIDKYFDKYYKCRNDDLLLGIEIGLRPDCNEENKDIILKNNFDYVIGSVHVVDGIDIYLNEYYKGRNKKETYNQYFEYMFNCIKKCNYVDCLGHIDYISRYSPYDDGEIYYRDYSDYIDTILKEIIDSGIVLELNTRRIEDEIAFNNFLDIYKRYNELGGKYVTLGSDAHVSEAIGHGFKRGNYIIDKCGLKTVYFKNRKIEYV